MVMIDDNERLNQTRLNDRIYWPIVQTYVVSLLSSQCVVVRRGDRLGVFSERRRSPVAYVFDKANPRTLAHSFANHTHPMEHGETVTFDPLVFPYAFSAAAYYFVVGSWSELFAPHVDYDM